jgi:hypothetical protein
MKHKGSLMSTVLATIVLVSLCAVSASVTTAQSSRASVQAPALVGAPVAGAPAVCEIGFGPRLHVFVKGADGALWWKYWDGATSSWTAWTSLGGKLTSDPAAAAVSDGQLEVYVRGTNGALYEKGTSDLGNYWSDWASLGGQLLVGTGPAAYAWGGYDNPHLGMFVTGTDHALWYMGDDYKWESLGGYLTSSPAAMSSGSGVVDVLVRGSNGAVYERTTTNGGASWFSWYSRGGQLLAGTGPAGAAWDSGYHVFVTGTNHALYWQNATSSTGWVNLGGYLTSSPAAAGYGNSSWSKIDVLVRGSDNGLWRKTSNNGAWGSWTSVSGPP